MMAASAKPMAKPILGNAQACKVQVAQEAISPMIN